MDGRRWLISGDSAYMLSASSVLVPRTASVGSTSAEASPRGAALESSRSADGDDAPSGGVIAPLGCGISSDRGDALLWRRPSDDSGVVTSE
jgi:hypothetical protein